MAERSGFFNAEQLANETFDRIYDAKDFASYFASFLSNGIFFKDVGNLLVAKNINSQMGVSVAPGQGFILGYWYGNNAINDVELQASSTQNRVDSVCLRLDLIARKVGIIVLTGVPSEAPVAPTLVRDQSYFDLRLANINVNANVQSILQTDIIDTRLNTQDCGIVHGLIDQLDTTAFEELLNRFIIEFEEKANEYYDETFVPAIEVIEASASDRAEQVITVLNAMISASDVAALNARLDAFEQSQPTNFICAVPHELEDYPSIHCYIFNDDGSVTFDDRGILTGAELTQIECHGNHQSDSLLNLWASANLGVFDSIQKINEQVFVVTFQDTIQKLYVQLTPSIQKSQRELFNVYWSQSSDANLNANAVEGWTGKFVENANVLYPDFYTALKTTYANLTTTKADYDARILANGACSLYVLDMNEAGETAQLGTIRFPTISNYVRAPRAGEDVTTEMGDAIRNLWGTFESQALRMTSNNSNQAIVFGACRMSYYMNRTPEVFSSTGNTSNMRGQITFEASTIVPTAAENRPKTQILFPWIVVK